MTRASSLMYQWSQMRVTVASAALVAPFSGGHQDQGTGGAARKDRLRMRRGSHGTQCQRVEITARTAEGGPYEFSGFI